MFLTSPAVLPVRMSQKLESYNQHSLNLEGWAVRVADLAAWYRMWTGALLRWQAAFLECCHISKRGKSPGPLFYSTLTVETVFSRRTELTVGWQEKQCLWELLRLVVWWTLCSLLLEKQKVWCLVEGAELAARAWYSRWLVCSLLSLRESRWLGQSERTPVRLGHPYCLVEIHMERMQTEFTCSVLMYPHLCHPTLRGQRGSFEDPGQNDDGTKL